MNGIPPHSPRFGMVTATCSAERSYYKTGHYSPQWREYYTIDQDWHGPAMDVLQGLEDCKWSVKPVEQLRELPHPYAGPKRLTETAPMNVTITADSLKKERAIAKQLRDAEDNPFSDVKLLREEKL